MKFVTAKYMLALIGLLAVSCAGNVYQVYRAGIHAEQQRSALTNAKAEGKVEAAKELAATNARIATAAIADMGKTAKRLEEIGTKKDDVRIVYRTVAAKAPLATVCAPGAERVAVINRALGGLK